MASTSERGSPRARVGCSGWQYKHWRGVFYPAELPASRWFEYYASQLDTVEINNTFYRLPEASTFAAWRKEAPRGFLYAVKASRFLTHMKKLKEPTEPLRRLFQRARRLQRTLGPVLYQLPPRWPVNLERLSAFVRALPKGRQHVLEFREPSWYNDEVFALLERAGVTVCLHDMAGSQTGKMAIGALVYVRFHGPTKYTGRYDERVLRTGPNGLRRRCDQDARSLPTSTTTPAAMPHGMLFAFGVRSRWRMASRHRLISRCSLLKGGHSRRLQGPEAPALIFLRTLHP